VQLTDLVVTCPRNSTVKNLTKAWKEGDVLAKWETSAWAKKIKTKKTRANLSDFDRFKVMVAKKQKSEIVSKKVASLK